jgi:hypothetical protein
MTIILKRMLVFIILITSILSLKAQYFEFNQLLSLQKRSINEINDYLTSKGWDNEFTKKTEDLYGGAEIGWIYKVKNENNIYLGRMILSYSEGFSNILYYNTNKDQFLKIKNNLKTSGYIFYKYFVEDNVNTSIYRDSANQVSFITNTLKDESASNLYYVCIFDYLNLEKKYNVLQDSIKSIDHQIINLELSKVKDISKEKIQVRDEKIQKVDSLLLIRDTIIVDYNSFYDTKTLIDNISISIMKLFKTEKYFMLNSPFNVELSVIFDVDTIGITKSNIEVINSNNSDFSEDLTIILNKLKLDKCYVLGVTLNARLIIQLNVDLSFIIYQVDTDGTISFDKKIPEEKILSEIQKRITPTGITYYYKDKVVQINIDNKEFIYVKTFQNTYDINRLK